jgi:hypothetical protein
MLTYLVERVRPPAFHPEDPENLALHCRWAADGYQKVGAFWLGGLVTGDRMFSLVAVEHEDALHRCRAALGFPEAETTLRQVVRMLGPSLAKPAQS